jgi:putative resolvase
MRDLNVEEASRLLGVSPNALRSWADTGLVRCWRTPGGHRRFEPSELLRIRAQPADNRQEAGRGRRDG